MKSQARQIAKMARSIENQCRHQRNVAGGSGNAAWRKQAMAAKKKQKQWRNVHRHGVSAWHEMVNNRRNRYQRRMKNGVIMAAGVSAKAAAMAMSIWRNGGNNGSSGGRNGISMASAWRK